MLGIFKTYAIPFPPNAPHQTMWDNHPNVINYGSTSTRRSGSNREQALFVPK